MDPNSSQKVIAQLLAECLLLPPQDLKLLLSSLEVLIPVVSAHLEALKAEEEETE